MKKYIIVLTILISTNLYAQWLQGIGNTGNDDGYAIAIDSSNNVFVTGGFEGTVDFDPSGGTTNLSSNGGSDIFLAKYSSTNGSLIWAESFGASSDDFGRAIALNKNGDIFVIGDFKSTVNFNPSSIDHLFNNGGSDIFLAKYSGTDGSLIWVEGFGSSGYDYSRAIAVDTSGDVYITGTIEGTADFDPSSDTTNFSSAGSDDIVLAKYSGSDGSLIWADHMGGTGSDICYSIAVDNNNNLYATGPFSTTVDFNPGGGTTNLTTTGTKTKTFFVKYNASNGALIWAKKIGTSSGYDGGKALALDANGNFYVTGYFQNTVDFDPGSGNVSFTSEGSYDIFVAKYNSSGAMQWAKSAGSSGSDFPNGIAVDSNNNVYVTGYFAGTANFNPSGTAVDLVSNGNSDIFLAKYNSAGVLQWAKNSGGSYNDYSYSVALDNNQDLYVTGSFQQTADFELSSGTEALTSTGNLDIFLERYSNSAPLPVELTSFTASINKNSIILSWQTATEINNSGFEIESFNPQAEKPAWVRIGFVKGYGTSNSNKSYSFVDNSTVSGKLLYRLKQIDLDGKFTFSNEVEVNKLAANYTLGQNYPNPFNPSTTIYFSLPGQERVIIDIYNSLGQKVKRLVNREYSGGEHSVVWDASRMASGMYFYTLRTEQFTESKKMLLLK